MPAVVPYVGYIIGSIIDDAVIGEAIAGAVATILEYAAVAELLSAAQKALNPAPKSGVGPGLYIGEDEDDI